MSDNVARTILGHLICHPALVVVSDELVEDVFTGRDKIIFSAILKIWEDDQPETIQLPILIDKLGEKVSATYVSSLLDGATNNITPDGFKSLVNELARQRIAKSVVKIVNDAGAEMVKTGQMDLSTLKPLLEKYSAIGDKEKVMSASIREWAMSTQGEFSLPMAYKEIGAKTTQEQGLVRVVIGKMVRDLVLTPVGRGYGHYRKVEKDLEEVDILGVKPSPVDLVLPLGLSSWVNIFPKSVVVFAGESNFGKTALVHNFIKDNMNKHRVHLLFSEGGQDSLVDRLSKHSDLTLGQWGFKAYERCRNHEDAVSLFPNDIWCVDYLDPPADMPWMVGTMIDNIYKRLDTGVAYINIQKNASSEYGRGGEWGKERSCLYVTVSKDNDIENDDPNIQYCIAKVLKAKAWKSRNPDGRHMPFRIVQGWKIEHYNVWNYPPKKEKRDTKSNWFKG